MAFPIDQSFKLLTEEDALGSLEFLAGVKVSRSAVVESLDRELNLERLHADHLYRVRDGSKACIHHFEALASYRAGWEESQIDHATYANIKYRLPVFSHLLIMQARGAPRSIPDRILRLSAALRVRLRVNIIRLWQRPAAEVLNAGRIALYPWTALMNASAEQQREAARRIHNSGREGLQMQMALLGAFRYGGREAFFERIGSMFLTKEILRESPLWQEIERDAREEGLAHGQALGQARGEAEGERRAVTRFLQARFGPLPEWVKNKLSTASTETLDLWAERAATADSLNAVFE